MFDERIFHGKSKAPVHSMLFEETLIQYALRHFREPHERLFLNDLVASYKGSFSEVFFQVFYVGMSNISRLQYLVKDEITHDPFEPYLTKLYRTGKLITSTTPLVKTNNNIELIPGILEMTISPMIIENVFQTYHVDATAMLENFYLKLELVVRDMYGALGLMNTPTDTTLFSLFLMVDGIWACQLDYDTLGSR